MAEELSPELLEQIRASWAAAQGGPVRLLDPLPWRLRLRIAFDRRVTDAGCWLIDHHHPAAADWLWRWLESMR